MSKDIFPRPHDLTAVEPMPASGKGPSHPSPMWPYNKAEGTVTFTLRGTSGQPMEKTYRVYEYIDQAEQYAGAYWHQGGAILESTGFVRGSRSRGWYLAGKWRTDQGETPALD